jgi:hypothetical protein
LIYAIDPTSPFTLHILTYLEVLLADFDRESLTAVEAALFIKGKQPKKSIILLLYYLMAKA